MRKFIIFVLLFSSPLALIAQQQQGEFNAEMNIGQAIHLAVADFKQVGTDPNTEPLRKTFNDTLWNDLSNAGIFDMVSKSFNPVNVPGSAEEMCPTPAGTPCTGLAAWGNAPVNAAFVAFGNVGVQGTEVAVNGWLYDTKNLTNPQVLGKQYREQATQENARIIAHRFADAIILQFGGIPGIAESKIYFVSNRTGSKEIWVMDYDGSNQQQITRLGSISLSPHVSPDGTRIAFSSMAHGGWQILMYSLDLGRIVTFPRFGGMNLTPAWSPDGSKIAWSSSQPNDPEIYQVDASGANPRRVTAYKGPDVSPVWNPKTGAQIAWVSEHRSGLPQIWIMESDGTNQQRVTDAGYAVSPSWSPNGLLLTFAWRRNYGPGVLGGQDIYVMDIASKRFVELTHERGLNDFPCWSPDGRHIVFQRRVNGRDQIWTMLADGSQQRQLTDSGSNSEPFWSAK
jgi:TolB protein